MDRWFFVVLVMDDGSRLTLRWVTNMSNKGPCTRSLDIFQGFLCCVLKVVFGCCVMMMRITDGFCWNESCFQDTGLHAILLLMIAAISKFRVLYANSECYVALPTAVKNSLLQNWKRRAKQSCPEQWWVTHLSEWQSRSIYIYYWWRIWATMR